MFGRTRTEKRMDPITGTVQSRDRLVPREQWEVLICDHHPGYITWENYEANTARLRGNWRRPRELTGGAVREGRALLQGLLRCGRCGRIMQTGYSGTKGNCPRYVCARAKQLYAGEHVCQSIGGIRLENKILDEMFAVLAPAALTATAQALAEADAIYQRDLAVFELAVERARYEADRARRQFDNVEPENRLVARTLEKNLESKLAAVRAAENDSGRPTRPPPGRVDRTRTGLDHHRRRRHPRDLRCTHHHDARAQTTHPRRYRRDRPDRAPPAARRRLAHRLARRRRHRGLHADDQARRAHAGNR